MKTIQKKKPKRKLSKKQVEGLEKLSEMKTGRFDYCENHQAIMREMIKFTASNGFPPTQKQLAAATQLSEVTIWKHCKEITLSNVVPDYRPFTPRILAGLAAKAAKGDAQAAKLWLQVIEGWIEKKANEHTGADGKPLFDKLDSLADDELDKEYKKLCEEIQPTAS